MAFTRNFVPYFLVNPTGIHYVKLSIAAFEAK